MSYIIDELIQKNFILKSGKINPHIENKIPFELRHKIIDATNFLEGDYILSVRINCIRQNIIKQPKCICGKCLFDMRLSKFKKYCSRICSNTSEETKSSYKQTMIKKYGVDNASKAKEIKDQKENTILAKWGTYQNKINETLSKPYKIGIHRENLNEKKQYYKSVETYTQRNKHNIKLIGEVGLAGTDGAYQLDHKFSRSTGLKNNIHPSIIGHKYNLEYLPWLENKEKSDSCSIELGTLLSLIETEHINCSLDQFKQMSGTI
jgi:hypothetical protein